MKEARVPDALPWNTVKKVAVVVCFMCLVETVAPQQYGKLATDALVTVPPKVGWWLMELPVTVTFGYLFWILGQPNSNLLVPRILGLIFSGHYLYRGWIYPYTLRIHPSSTSGFSLMTALGGWLVTIMHGYLHAKWLGKHGKRFESTAYLKSLNFCVGLLIYYTGFFLIVQQDGIMRAIRDNPNSRRYEIPKGGLWDYSTSGNYLAELIAWFGLWVLTDFGPNGAFIFFVSAFNLVPRAYSNYTWYTNKFGEEFTSLNRAILIPGVW